MEYEEPMIIIQKGDIITSKEGFVAQSPATKKWYKYHKKEYLGNGGWQILDDKIEVEVLIKQ